MQEYLHEKVNKNSAAYGSVFEAYGQEFDALNLALDEIFAQALVDTAGWGLAYWEAQLGLPVEPINVSLNDRRARIKSVISPGTMTIYDLEHAIAQFNSGTIRVIEDFPAYNVIIQFVDVHGVPADIAYIEKVLRDLIPAHLDIELQFNFFTWDELDAMGWTWADLDALGLTWDEIEIYA